MGIRAERDMAGGRRPLEVGAMDTFQYVCRADGVVAVFYRNEVLGAKPPTRCPYCGGPLGLEVIHADEEVARRGSAA
jgi:hypothetical protein